MRGGGPGARARSERGCAIKGEGVRSGSQSSERKGKGGGVAMTACFISDELGSGGRVTGGATRRRGVGGVGPAWCGRQQPGQGAHERRVTCAETGESGG
jgi:hypothetical protein